MLGKHCTDQGIVPDFRFVSETKFPSEMPLRSVP